MLAQLNLKLRRWVSLMFNKSETIKSITDTAIDEEHYNMMDKWNAIYKGYFEEWHKVKEHTINGQKKRTLNSLNMAKVLTQELSKLIFTERVKINISDQTFNDNINDVFKKNRFDKVFQGKLEQMFALGGLVLKANPKQIAEGQYKLNISYVTPDCFVPISYESGEITEAAFMTTTRKGKKVYCLFETHKWETVEIEGELKQLYIVKNELYEGEEEDGSIKKVPLETLYPHLEKYVPIENLTQPLFQYIRPNVANNFDANSPLGVSIYANALDTLKAIDIAFDSFIREFRLGKRRIIVPSTAIKSVVNPQTGSLERYFDADDEAYQAMDFDDPEKQKIVDNTVSLRVQDHISAINALLNILAMQTGFSAGTFTFDGQGVKTATEIVSENSKTYQTKQINEIMIGEALEKFIKTLGEVGELYDIFEMPNEEYEVEFQWDDTIVKDKYADSDYYIKLKNAGIISGKYAIQHTLDTTEEQAEKMLREMQEEEKASMPTLPSEEEMGDMANNRDASGADE